MDTITAEEVAFDVFRRLPLVPESQADHRSEIEDNNSVVNKKQGSFLLFDQSRFQRNLSVRDFRRRVALGQRFGQFQYRESGVVGFRVDEELRQIQVVGRVGNREAG